MESAKRYRSSFRAKARQIEIEGAELGEDVIVELEPGKTIDAKNGDYIVELEDERVERWERTHFEREMEPEPEAKPAQSAPRRLELHK